MHKDDAPSRLEARVVTFTPEEALATLERSKTRNRSISIKTVLSFSNQMRSGGWALNGEPIIIDENGDIADGHHRLQACVEADIPFQTLLVIGARPEAFETIDTGRSRNGKDVLTIKGINHQVASCCSAAAGFAMPFERSGVLSSKSGTYDMTPRVRARWVEENPRIIEISETVLSYPHRPRPMAPGESTFLFFFMEKKMRDETAEFFRGVLVGTNLGERDPRFHLRQRLQAQARASYKWTRAARFGAVIRSWDWFVRGRPVLYPQNVWRDLDTAGQLISPKES